MSATTPTHQLPYPTGTDRVSSVDDTLKTAMTKIDALIPHMRSGKISVSSVPRAGFQNFTVTFNQAMPNANYTIIITLAGHGNWSPEMMVAAAKTDAKTSSGFSGRIRNNANSAQPCEIHWLVIGQQ